MFVLRSGLRFSFRALEVPKPRVRKRSFSLTKTLRFWWTESPLKSPQKSARESRPTQKKALESKCTLLSAQKSALIFRLALQRAQEIAQKSKTLKKAPKRVGFSRKCSGEWVTQKRCVLKGVCH